MSRLHELLTTTNGMNFGGNNTLALDVPNQPTATWPMFKEMQSGLIEHAPQTNTASQYIIPLDQSSASSSNAFHSSDAHQTPWNIGLNGTTRMGPSLHSSQPSHSHVSSSRAVERSELSISMDNSDSRATHHQPSNSERRQLQAYSFQESDTQTPERRFEAILEAVDSAGFQSFDEMATEYYTSSLDEESSLRTTQKFSRERQLKAFLKALNHSAKEWSARETWAYREEILESAQNMLTDEVSRLAEERLESTTTSSEEAIDSCSSEAKSGGNNNPSLILECFDGLLNNVEVNKCLKREMRGLREGVGIFFPSSSSVAFDSLLTYPVLAVTGCMGSFYQSNTQCKHSSTFEHTRGGWIPLSVS